MCECVGTRQSQPQFAEIGGGPHSLCGRPQWNKRQMMSNSTPDTSPYPTLGLSTASHYAPAYRSVTIVRATRRH
jgi:hypothetical protein